MPPHRPKTSEVWNHFTQIEYQKAKCGYCSAIISTSGGSLSNLKRHMKSKHYTIPLSTNQRNVMEETVDDPVEAGPSGSQGPSRAETLPIIAESSGTSRHRSDGQSTISSYFSRTKPSRKTVSNSMIPLLYHETYAKVKDLMTSCHAVCLTTDGWTSINNESFLGVTAHFIDENASLQSVCLGCEKFEEKHTIQNLALFLKNTVREWRIENKVTAIVSDNAPNIVGAIRECNFRHVSCFAHNVNLIVQQGLKNISLVQKKVKSIVEYFKRSSHAQSKLQEMQQQMGLPLLKLKQDVVTRWNSTYDMFKRILEIKDAVVSTLAILQCDIEQLTVAEWQIVERSTDILIIFSEVTREMSSEQYISMSKTLIFIQSMTDTMRNFQNNVALPKEVTGLVTTLLDKLQSRFASYEDNQVVTLAALLDPRFKKMAFNGYHERKLEIAIDLLKRKVCRVTLPDADPMLNANPTESTSTRSEHPFSTSSLIWKKFDEQYEALTASINPTAAGIIEMDRYFKEPLISRNEDPLKWWTTHKTLYPRLFIMVKRQLCVTATSVPCERLFSKAGMVITERRTRMLASKSSQVLFLNQNLLGFVLN